MNRDQSDKNSPLKFSPPYAVKSESERLREALVVIFLMIFFFFQIDN